MAKRCIAGGLPGMSDLTFHIYPEKMWADGLEHFYDQVQWPKYSDGYEEADVEEAVARFISFQSYTPDICKKMELALGYLTDIQGIEPSVASYLVLTDSVSCIDANPPPLGRCPHLPSLLLMVVGTDPQY
jgi:hypothetical protein